MFQPTNGSAGVTPAETAASTVTAANYQPSGPSNVAAPETRALRSARALPWWVAVALVAVLYYAAARLGLLLAFEKTNATPVWPPSGLAFAAVLLLGTRAWPGVFAGAFAANLAVFATNHTAHFLTLGAVSAGIALGNTVEALAGAWLFRRWIGAANPLHDVAAVLHFVAAATLMGLVSATIASASLLTGDIIPPALWSTVGVTWWLGDVAGVLILTPALLALCGGITIQEPLSRRREASGKRNQSLLRPAAPVPETGAHTSLGNARSRSAWHRCESVGLLLVLTGVAAVPFGGWLPRGLDHALMFLLFPVFLWPVFRLGQREATVAVVAVSLLAIWQTVQGVGPFARLALNESLLLLQGFVCVIAITIHALTAALAERRRAETALQHANENLTRQAEEVLTLTHTKNQVVAERLRDLTESRLAALNMMRDSEDSRRLAEQAGAHLANANEFLQMEITERKRAEERFRLVVEAAPSAMLMVDDERGVITLVNAQAEALFGHARAELLGQPVEMLVPERFRLAHPGDRSGFFRAPSMRAMGAGRDLFGLRKDGSEVPIEIGLNPIRTPEGHFVLASIINIAERTRHERQIEASLHEKEVLLKEIHHRVKNNLQVISSILHMQSRAIEDPYYRGIFGECQDRVRTMALVHEKLYRSQSLASIDIGEEVRELAAMLASSYGRPGVCVSVEVEPALVDVEIAVPLGLVLNELVSNALKHAFPDGRAGTVSVRLARPTPDQLRLSVRDDGRGLPDDFTWQRAKSLGLTMVNALARQIRAAVDVRQEGGTEFTMTFSTCVPGQERGSS